MSGTRVDSAVTVSSIFAGDSSGSGKLGGSGYMISPPYIKFTPENWRLRCKW